MSLRAERILYIITTCIYWIVLLLAHHASLAAWAHPPMTRSATYFEIVNNTRLVFVKFKKSVRILYILDKVCICLIILIII